jgi:hypothetical protein
MTDTTEKKPPRKRPADRVNPPPMFQPSDWEGVR